MHEETKIAHKIAAKIAIVNGPLSSSDDEGQWLLLEQSRTV
jgi:hypothetical protein